MSTYSQSSAKRKEATANSSSIELDSILGLERLPRSHVKPILSRIESERDDDDNDDNDERVARVKNLQQFRKTNPENENAKSHRFLLLLRYYSDS